MNAPRSEITLDAQFSLHDWIIELSTETRSFEEI